MKHDPHCTGCPLCDPEMRTALSAFTRGDYTTYCAWLTKQDAKRGIRTAGARGELRCGITFVDQEDDMETHDRSDRAPDPYAPGIAALLAARGLVDLTKDAVADQIVEMELFRRSWFDLTSTGRMAAAEPATSREHLEAPDPYAATIAKRQEGRR